MKPFMIRLTEKVGASQFLARLLAPAVDRALPQPTPQGGQEVTGPEKNPLADEQGVIRVPRHYELSPDQVDHVLRRIHYDKKHKELAEEIAGMAKAQQGTRPYTVG